MGSGEPDALHALPETRQALSELSKYEDEDLNETFDRLAADVQRLAPECGGMTISYLREGLAFTWLSTTVEAASLDGVQYLDGGPCVEAARTGKPDVSSVPPDPLNEERWAIFAQVAAARGIRSTLSLPLVQDDTVVGGVNLYGTTPDAFEGRHEELAGLLGAWGAGAVTNADLTMTTVDRSRKAPQAIDDRVMVDQAVSMVMAARGLDPDTARQRLESAAERAGIETSLLAHVVVKSRLLE
jgi:GAF domain-containing protein